LLFNQAIQRKKLIFSIAEQEFILATTKIYEAQSNVSETSGIIINKLNKLIKR
jgi:hypothetical protein